MPTNSLKEQNWTIIFRIQLMWRHILALQKDNKYRDIATLT